MANYKLKFLDAVQHDLTATVECTSYEYELHKYRDCIEILLQHDDDGISFIMDRSTAIKFAKTLRTEINKLTEIENSNG